MPTLRAATFLTGRKVSFQTGSGTGTRCLHMRSKCADSRQTRFDSHLERGA